MDLLALFKDIQHEPLALIVLGGIVILRLIDLAVKHAPQWFSKEKTVPFYKWQGFVSESIHDILRKIEDISATLSAHEFLLDKTSEGTLENQLFNDNLSPFIRLKAFRRLLAMKKNGRVWQKGLQLIINNKDLWLDVLDTELGIKLADAEYYQARLDEIRRQIFDDFSRKRGET